VYEKAKGLPHVLAMCAQSHWRPRALVSKEEQVKCPLCRSLTDPAAFVCSHCQRDVPGTQRAA